MYCDFYYKVLLLGTGERDGRDSGHIDEHCARCGQVETDGLLFTCSFARAVWFYEDPSLLADHLPEYHNLEESQVLCTQKLKQFNCRGKKWNSAIL
jgi:hypothetical protein